MADPNKIAAATEEDLAWLRAGIDREDLERRQRREIEEALNPVRWIDRLKPIDVDEALLR